MAADLGKKKTGCLEKFIFQQTLKMAIYNQAVIFFSG